MSYHIVQKIEIVPEEKKVYITSSDNNVWPRTPYRWYCSYYDKMMLAGDIAAVDADILEAYDKGNFQAGRQNKYTRALVALRMMPEYHAFDWRGNWDEAHKNQEEKPEEYQKLLRYALLSKLPAASFVIRKPNGDGLVYMRYRRGGRFARWTMDAAKATKWRFIHEAENMIKNFTGSDNWTVTRV